MQNYLHFEPNIQLNSHSVLFIVARGDIFSVLVLSHVAGGWSAAERSRQENKEGPMEVPHMYSHCHPVDKSKQAHTRLRGAGHFSEENQILCGTVFLFNMVCFRSKPLPSEAIYLSASVQLSGLKTVMVITAK